MEVVLVVAEVLEHLVYAGFQRDGSTIERPKQYNEPCEQQYIA